MASKSVTCPHCNKAFTVEGSGITAAIRVFTRNYMAAHPHASVDEVGKAFLRENPDANLSTIMTQVRAAY
jgi:hypothetical protein